MVKIKFLHFSDSHGDSEQLEHLKKYAGSRDDIRFVLCSGDILGPCLNGQQAQKVNADLETILKNHGKPVQTEEDLKTAFKNSAESSDPEVREAATSYLALEKRFDEISAEKYGKFRDQIKGFKQQVLLIPGNWDTPANYIAALKDHNLHGGQAKLDNLTIAGYGGANSVPKFMPQLKMMPYSEEEYAKFLEKTKADILVSHMPPKGALDGKEQIGSSALEDYIKKEQPRLVLCGHNHHAGCTKIGKTLIVNSGNLGQYFNQKIRGTFSEVEIDGDDIRVTQYQMDEKGKVSKIK